MESENLHFSNYSPDNANAAGPRAEFGDLMLLTSSHDDLHGPPRTAQRLHPWASAPAFLPV